MGSQISLTGPTTIHYTTDGSDPRLTGGNVNPSATSAATGSMITINQSQNLKARSRAGNGEWSALTNANFTVGASDLIISEIMYHPMSNPLAEFLEIRNTGSSTVSLTGLKFSDGIIFDFNENSSIGSLASGAHLLIVRDLDAFLAVYGNGLNSQIAGIFQEDSALDNDGETLAITDANDDQVLSFTYNDAGAWPDEADGNNYSLVFSGGNVDLGNSWRPSSSVTGNPGVNDSTPFIGGSLLDYALVEEPILTPSETGSAFSFSTHLTADDATYTVEYSADLMIWQPADLSGITQQIGSTNTSDSTRIFSVNLPQMQKGFARVIVSQR